MATVEELLERNEAFKIKWLQLTEDDLFNWLVLQDEMITLASNMKSEYLENKLGIDKEKAMRSIELKMKKDENWKAPTEKRIDAVLKKEFFEKDLEQTVLKNSYELLQGRSSTITEYINIVKMFQKKNYSL